MLPRKRGVFDELRHWLVSRGFSYRSLFWLTGLLSFFLSPIADNLTTALIIQTIANMGVTMGLLPTKGMPLPFISSGRSSLLVSLVMAAILIKLGRDVKQPKTPSIPTPSGPASA